jgi:nucleoside-diphosphate-sugar epimerase
MRILIAGATGVLGRATLPHLKEHDVTGLTRTREKLGLLRALGADAFVCDVYDYPALLAIVTQAQPETVVNFLTDLSAGSAAANSRIRREGATNVFNAAAATGAARLVVESVAFSLEGDAGAAVEELEQATRTFAGEALVLRFGRLWGPGTFHESPREPPAVEIGKAGAEAARLTVAAPAGTYVVT